MSFIVRLFCLAAAIGVVAFIVGGFRALGQVDLSCPFEGHGRRSLLVGHYLCSPKLLKGGLREWFVFAWLWSFPLIVFAFSGHASLKSRRARHSNPIVTE